MKEAFQHIDNDIIFRETFSKGEQGVRRNHGIPTNANFEQGLASITNSGTANRIEYPYQLNFNDVISIRIILKLNTLNSGFRYFLTIRDISDAANRILCRVDNATDLINLTGSTASLYLNGATYVNQSLAATVGVWYDFVIVTTATDFGKIMLNVDGTPGVNNSDFSYDLVEIYNRALTAAEVANL